MSQKQIRLSEIPPSVVLGVLLDVDDLWVEFSDFGATPAGSVRIRLPYQRPLNGGDGRWALDAPGEFAPLAPPEWHSPSQVRPAEDARLISAFEAKVAPTPGKNAFTQLRLTVEDLVCEGRPFFYPPRFLAYSAGEILESKMCSLFNGFSRGQDRSALAAGHETPVFRTDPYRVARIYFRSLVHQMRLEHQVESRNRMGATLQRLGVSLDWSRAPAADAVVPLTPAASGLSAPRP